MTTQDQDELKIEAAHLYRCLFAGRISSDIAELYVHAHEVLTGLNNPAYEQLHTVRVIVTNGLSATAVEPWLRGADRRHLLISKLHLLSYLSECSACPSSFSRSGRHRSVNLMVSGLLGAVSLLRGYYLKTRYGLV